MNFDDFLKNYPMYKNRLIFSSSFIYEHSAFAKSVNDIKTLVDWCTLKSIPINKSLTEKELTKLMYHIKANVLSESALIATIKSYNGNIDEISAIAATDKSNVVKPKEPIKSTKQLSLKEQIDLELKQILLTEAPKKLPKDKTSGKVSEGDIDNFDGLGNDLPDEEEMTDTPPEGEGGDAELPPEDGEDAATADEETPPEEGEGEIDNAEELDMGDETPEDMPEDPSEKYQNDDVKAFEDDDGADTDPNDDNADEETPPEEGEGGDTELPPEDAATADNEDTPPEEGADEDGLPPEDGGDENMDDFGGEGDLDTDYEDEDEKPLTKKQMKKTELIDKYEDLLEVIDNALSTLTSGNIKRLTNTDTDVETLRYIKVRINKMKDEINDLIENDLLSKPIQDLEAKYIENKISLTNFIELLLNISKNSSENK